MVLLVGEIISHSLVQFLVNGKQFGIDGIRTTFLNGKSRIIQRFLKERIQLRLGGEDIREIEKQKGAIEGCTGPLSELVFDAEYVAAFHNRFALQSNHIAGDFFGDRERITQFQTLEPRP